MHCISIKWCARSIWAKCWAVIIAQIKLEAYKLYDTMQRINIYGDRGISSYCLSVISDGWKKQFGPKKVFSSFKNTTFYHTWETDISIQILAKLSGWQFLHGYKKSTNGLVDIKVSRPSDIEFASNTRIFFGTRTSSNYCWKYLEARIMCAITINITNDYMVY